MVNICVLPEMKQKTKRQRDHVSMRVLRDEQSGTGPEFDRHDILLCATRGRVYAIHKQDGRRLWRVKLRTGSSSAIQSIYVTENDKVLVGGNGRVACIELMTGSLVWIQKMPRRWLSNEVSVISVPVLCSIIDDNGDKDQLMEIIQQLIYGPRSSAATTTSSSDSPSSPPPYECNKPTLVIASTWGRCFAFDIATGEQAWRFNCPKGGFNFPCFLLEGQGPAKCDVYIGCGKMVYCLEAATGQLKWQQRITNSWFTSNYMTLATPWSSQLATETFTGGFQSQPSVQIKDLEAKISITIKMALSLLVGGMKLGFTQFPSC